MELQFETLTKILPQIRARAGMLDRSGDWPDEDLRDLNKIGASRWFVPTNCGGEGIEPLELHLRYEAIASASLATALIVSQRDSAVGLIDGAENRELRQELLPRLARGEIFATVGIAQLTTSRQGGLRAVPDGDGYLLTGVIPWCTGAKRADFVIAGAVTGDDQILFALPTNSPGVNVRPPMELVSLQSSWTSSVELNSVRLDRRQILRGPAAKVLSGNSRGIPLSQTFLAFGSCRGTIELIASDASSRAQATAAKFQHQLEELRQEVLEICRGGTDTDAVPRLRAAAIDLALRTSQSAVALQKGSGLLLDHPAQRLAREAMFFLVWSCSDPVIDCTVNVLAGGG